jgi:hypothetical protein
MSVTSLFGWSTVGEAPDDHISNAIKSQVASGLDECVVWPHDGRKTQVKPHSPPRTQETSLDVLLREDQILKDLFERVSASRGSSVEDRYDYGNAAKQIIRHLATRQAALMNVGHAISDSPAMRPAATRMIDRGTDRRGLIDELGDMSRAIQSLYLNQGQDFDTPLTALIEAVNTEIDWELALAIPFIEHTLSASERTALFASARYIERHAPTTLSTSGPRWYEHLPVFSRMVTLFDHLRDHPRADRVKRIS